MREGVDWGRLKPDRPARVALGVIACGCALLLWEARGATFAQDEWSFILFRRGFSADVFLRPHVNHLSVIPIAAYKLLLAIFGLTAYLPYILLLLLLHATACLLLYVLLRRYVGPWAAVAPVAIVAVLGPAWHDLIWGFQIGFVGSVAAGLGMTLCLERQDRGGDIGAAVLLLVSLTFSSVFIPFAVIGTVMVLLQPPRRWSRLWVIGVPLALYGLWYSRYGVSAFEASNVPMIPAYLWHALSAAVASITGIGGGTPASDMISVAHGELLAGELLALLIIRLVRGRGAPPLTWAALLAVLALWVAQVLNFNPARGAGQSRYQYAPAILLLIIAASAARGWRPGRRSLAVLGVATAAICASNVVLLNSAASGWRIAATYMRAELEALQLGRNVVAPGFRPNLIIAPTGRPAPVGFLSAANYFAAVKAFGSPADSAQQLVTAPEAVRETVDLLLGKEERIRPMVPRGRTAGLVVCPSAQVAPAGRVLPFGVAVVRNAGRAPVLLELRRFGGAFHFLRWSLGPRTSAELVLPRDLSSVTWRVGCTTI